MVDEDVFLIENFSELAVRTLATVEDANSLFPWLYEARKDKEVALEASCIEFVLLFRR